MVGVLSVRTARSFSIPWAYPGAKLADVTGLASPPLKAEVELVLTSIVDGVADAVRRGQHPASMR